MRVYSVLLALTAAAYAVAQEPATAAPDTTAAAHNPVTFKLPTVGVQTVTHVTLDPVDGHVTGTYTTQEGGEEAAAAPAAGDKQGAFAGELEDPRIAGDKAAFAGIDDHFRVAVNAVRVSDNLDPVAADAPLKLAAYRVAKDLATADKPEAVDDINKMVAGVGMPDPLGYAAQEGFKGTAVKAVAHVEDAAVNRQVTDKEGAVMSAVGKWTASKDAFAGLEDPTHKSIGSMGYLSASGRAYYVTLLGK